MKMKKVFMNDSDRDYLLDRLEDILHDNHCLDYKDEICDSFCKYITSDNRELKPFNLEAAEAGKPVCTRDGRKARIICWDLKSGNYCLAAAVETKADENFEEILTYDKNGIFTTDSEVNHEYDLMMATEKTKLYVNIYKNKDGVYVSRVQNSPDIETLNLASSFLIGTICITMEDYEIIGCHKAEKP